MATKKSKFSRADEEKLIDFVKSHEILFNVKHKEFRNTEKKNRLWLELSTDLGTDGSYCCCKQIVRILMRIILPILFI